MNAQILDLFTFAGRKKLLVGNEQGRAVFDKLRDAIAATPGPQVYEVSLKGIEATDASFPRESVVSLAKQLRGEKGIFLSNFVSQDLLDNWDYAAKAKDQPMVVRDALAYRLIGPPLGSRSEEIFKLAMGNETVTTSAVSVAFGISAQNASAALKKLHGLGLLLGNKEPAESGGLEYVYRAVGAR
jgi:hypothetical protein